MGWTRVVAAGAVLLGTVLGVGSVGQAGGVAPSGIIQPTGTLDVTVAVQGLRHTEADTVTPEIYNTTGTLLGTCESATPATNTFSFQTNVSHSCDLAAGDYQLGLDPLFEGYETFVFCFGPIGDAELIDDPSAVITIAAGSTTSCTIVVSTTILIIDKEVVDPFELLPDPLASASDFTLEVFPDAGGDPLTGVDPSDSQCDSAFTASADTCLLLDLPDGDYTLGEVPVEGYLPSVTSCTNGVFRDERIVDPDGEITAVASSGAEFIKCVVRNTYAEGDVVLTKTLTNDDGGTATLGDFTLELYRASDNSLVTSGVCADTGACLSGSFPIGDYIVGEVGPNGYTRTVTQSIVNPTEALPDADAAFTLDPFAEVTVNVASDDIATTTTTTTTTTLAPTTTVAPTTTQGPTTTALGAGGILPATGQSDSSAPLSLAALALLLVGGGTLALSRRRT